MYLMDAGWWNKLSQAMAGLMFVWAMAKRFLPEGLRDSFQRYVGKFWAFFNPYVEVTFREYSAKFSRSEAYDAIRTYLGATTTMAAKRLTAEVGKNGRNLVLGLDYYEQVADEFHGAQMWWTSGLTRPSGTTITWNATVATDRKYYTLTFHRAHRRLMEDYLRHVMAEGKAIELKSRKRKIFTNDSSGEWNHVVFKHPSTFDTLAMHPAKKAEIVQDLDSFRAGKDFYARIGRTWKRGYLLYGPPGTGKSSMIAAMANHMEYDVYDLELTAVNDNTELRKLLLETKNKSLIVIEDIDCSEDLSRKRKTKKDRRGQPPAPKWEPEPKKEGSKVTLSGLLNFIDGLWSSCGEERLIVFTTNHVKMLDPALIRRGRMDVHIEMSYCCFEGFKVLAKNYLQLEQHPMFEKVKELMEVEGLKITPADVAENLMPKTKSSSPSATAEENATMCMESLIEALSNCKANGEAADDVQDDEEEMSNDPSQDDSHNSDGGEEYVIVFR